MEPVGLALAFVSMADLCIKYVLDFSAQDRHLKADTSWWTIDMAKGS